MPHDANVQLCPHLTQLQFGADPLAVRGALADALVDWRKGGLGDACCATAQQVLAEVLNNVVEHAHTDRPDGKIRLETRRDGMGLACVVMDDGAGLPSGQLPAGQLAEIGDALDDLPEGGFGWFMIRSLTSDLAYERREGWNRLSFTISGDSPDSAA